MAEPSISERVAVEVMLYTRGVHDIGPRKGEPRWDSADGWTDIEDFDPEHDLAQAFEALEHWRAGEETRWFEIDSPWGGSDDYDVYLGVEVADDRDLLKGSNPSLSRAICLALLEAVGQTGEKP